MQSNRKLSCFHKTGRCAETTPCTVCLSLTIDQLVPVNQRSWPPVQHVYGQNIGKHHESEKLQKKEEQDLHLRLHRPQWAGEMFKFMTQSEKDWSSVDCYQPVLSENNMQSGVCSDLHAPLNADSDLANLYLWRTTEAIREEESAISDAVLSLFFSYHGNAEEEQHHYSQYWLISWGTEKSHYTNMITQRRKFD